MEDKVDPRWRKSSSSGNGGGSCVEVGEQAARVLVRDTKNRSGAVLRFTPDAWRRFADQVKRSLATDRDLVCRCLSTFALSESRSAPGLQRFSGPVHRIRDLSGIGLHVE